MPETCCVMYIRSGSVYWRKPGNPDESGDSREPGKASAGDLFLLPPDSGVFMVAVPSTEIVYFRFDVSFLEQLSADGWDDDQLDPAGELFWDIRIICPAAGTRETLSRIIQALVEENERKKPGYRSMTRLRFLELLFTIKRLEGNPAENGISGSVPLRKDLGREIGDIAQYIRKNYSEEFSLADLAARCGLNPSYFSRVFKETTGSPPFAYLNRIRIGKSCHLLKRSGMSILEIAYSVGYNNVSFFNRYFRKIMNMSPRDYRISSRR